MSFVVKGMQQRVAKLDLEIQEKKEKDVALAVLDRQHEHELRLQRLSGIIDLAKSCLNYAILVNGVAIITIFTFLGAVLKDFPNAKEQSLALINQLFPALVTYLFGVTFGGLLVYFSWLAQTYFYTHGYKSYRGIWFRRIAGTSGLLSLTCFVVGSLWAILHLGH